MGRTNEYGGCTYDFIAIYHHLVPLVKWAIVVTSGVEFFFLLKSLLPLYLDHRMFKFVYVKLLYPMNFCGCSIGKSRTVPSAKSTTLLSFGS